MSTELDSPIFSSKTLAVECTPQEPMGAMAPPTLKKNYKEKDQNTPHIFGYFQSGNPTS